MGEGINRMKERIRGFLNRIKGIRIFGIFRFLRLPKIGVPRGFTLYLSLGFIFIIIVIILLNFTGIISFKRWQKQIATTKTYAKISPVIKNFYPELKTKWKNYLIEREKKKKEREKDELVLLRKKLRLKEKQLLELEKGLKRKEKEIEQKSIELKREKSVIEAEKRRVKEQTQNLQKREGELRKKELPFEQEIETKAEELKKEISSENIERLAKIYQEMRPERSAEIIIKLDDKLIISLFKKMKERNISQILAAMKTEDAVRISSLISEK